MCASVYEWAPRWCVSRSEHAGTHSLRRRNMSEPRGWSWSGSSSLLPAELVQCSTSREREVRDVKVYRTSQSHFYVLHKPPSATGTGTRFNDLGRHRLALHSSLPGCGGRDPPLCPLPLAQPGGAGKINCDRPVRCHGVVIHVLPQAANSHQALDDGRL